MILFIGAIVILLFYILYWTKKYQFVERKLAPGPLRLPVLGTTFAYLANGPTLPWKCASTLAKKHGDFMSMSFANTYLVFLNSYELMHDLLNREEWSAKFCHDVLKTRTFGKELGLAFVGDCDLWPEMRKFSQRTLRDFGFGKRLSMHGVIEDELDDTIKEIKSSLKTSNGILRIQDNFTLSIINILWSMLTGIRYSHDDPKLLRLLQLTFGVVKVSTFLNPLLLFPNFTKFLQKTLPSMSLNTHYQNFFQQLHTLVQPIVEERKRKGDYLTEPQNYIDVFLRKIKETEKNPNSCYSEEQLIVMLEDFWLVGSMTTSATLSYAILFLVLNPDVQKKVQDEIDTFVPRHSIPSVEDIEKLTSKPQMPYTQATILEIHRLACVVPVPIPRIMSQDTTFNGWKVPKGTLVLSNHWAVLMDKEYWGDPESFRPERFINDKGEFVPDKRVVHFGFGKRYCIGVTLVNSVIPMFVTTFLQKFNISLVPGEKLPNMRPNIGMSCTPYPFNVQLAARN